MACLKKTRATLLVERRWRYLRYLHAREAFALACHDIDSVLAIGVGKGLAELALAIEYPHVRFHLTDIESATTPNWSFVRRAVSEWNLTNVEFDILDILEPPSLEADMVCSTEVLEHIEQFDRAAANMLAAARKYVFALVPFADRQYNADPARRQRVLDTHGHHVCGFDRSALVDLFPDTVEIRGCYWTDSGLKFRALLDSMDAATIRNSADDLVDRAFEDVTPGRVPTLHSEAEGIWTLARATAPA